MALSNKQRIWLDEYLQCWNATEAARRAGYKQARQSGSENLSKPDIRAAIAARMEEVAMPANEVLARLSEQGRNEAAQYIRAELDQDGKLVGYFDLKQCIRDGKQHLIKKMKYDSNGNLEIEVFDAQAALIQMGRHHGLFNDKTDLTSDGQPLRILLDWGEAPTHDNG